MYFSKEQHRFLKLIRKKKIHSLTDFYNYVLTRTTFFEKCVFKKPLAKSDKANKSFQFISKGTKIEIKHNDDIITPTSEENLDQIILYVEEFIALLKYLETQRMVVFEDEGSEKTMYLCKNRSEILLGALAPSEEIKNKKFIWSTRIRSFRGYTVDESIQHFERIVKILALGVPIAVAILTFLLGIYGSTILEIIKKHF